MGAIDGEAAPGLYPVLPLSDTAVEMADISLDGDEQEIAVGPSNTVESVPAAPAQVEIINGVKRCVIMLIIWYGIVKVYKQY